MKIKYEFSFIIIVILILFILKYNKLSNHNFWDKQIVMRKYYDKMQIIGKTPLIKVILKKNMKISIKNDNFNEVYNFLQQNFSNDYNIDVNYFKYTYFKKKAYNITLYNKNKIIGFMHSYPIEVNYLNVKKEIYYVDYLCVKKSFRLKNIASLLIATQLNAIKSRYQPFLFKIDFYRLPFQHIIKSKYYIKDIKVDNKILLNDYLEYLNSKNFNYIFNYVNNLLNKFELRKLYSKSEFCEIFLEKQILSLIIINNKKSKFKTIIIGKKNKYKFNNINYNCFEIDLILGEHRENIHVFNILSSFLKKYKYDYICIPFLGSNIKFIQDNNFEEGNKVYYYSYNLGFPEIKLEHFCFNIN